MVIYGRCLLIIVVSFYTQVRSVTFISVSLSWGRLLGGKNLRNLAIISSFQPSLTSRKKMRRINAINSSLFQARVLFWKPLPKILHSLLFSRAVFKRRKYLSYRHVKNANARTPFRHWSGSLGHSWIVAVLLQYWRWNFKSTHVKIPQLISQQEVLPTGL